MATLPFFLWDLPAAENSSAKLNFCYGAGTAFVITFRRFSGYFKPPEKISAKLKKGDQPE